MSWVAEEMETLDLGDQRLNKRTKELLSRLQAVPSRSVPSACRGWSETQAAYRFFSNRKVTAEKVLAPHTGATRARMAEHRIVLCIQDTSELNYSGQTQTQGLGPLSNETHRGLLLHPTIAITPDRLCLGVIDSHVWARDDATLGKKVLRQSKRIEEKESYRWIEGYRGVCQVCEELPQTQCVYMADRESDIYELFVEGEDQAHRADWLIRASYDRLVLEDSRLSEELGDAAVLSEIEFKLPSSHDRENKSVRQRVKAVRVNLRVPRRRNSENTLIPVEVTAVIAEEINPPKGEEPITWVLLTNLEVNTAELAIEKIQWYLCRWQIEIYFRVLKSGCTVEKLQLEHTERLKPALALYMIVAWRILYLTVLSRECPKVSCEAVFDKAEWQAVYLISRCEPPPKKPPELNTIVRMIASLGGFLARKGDGEPGPKTIWIGLQRTRDFVWALEANNMANTS